MQNGSLTLAAQSRERTGARSKRWGVARVGIWVCMIEAPERDRADY